MDNKKQEFIDNLLNHLEGINYVVLKHLDKKTDPESNADIDLLLETNEVEPILEFARNYPTVEKMLTRYTKSMVKSYIHFQNGDFLQLDLLFKLVRVQYEYMMVMEVLSNKKKAKPDIQPTRRTDSSSM